jgi:hypothetical protein
MALKLESYITLNSAGFEQGLNKVTSSIASTIKSYALGAIGVYTLQKAFSETIATSKELVNESKRMGVTIEMLQVLRKAAGGAGVEMDKLAEAMERVNEFRAKALGGGPESGMALRQARQLGISRQDLTSSSAQDILFKDIGAKLKTVNPQDIAGPLKEVVGRGFGPLIPVLTKDLGALQTKMESLGLIISTKTAVELNAFDAQMKGITGIFVTALAPVLVQLVEMFLRAITSGGLLTTIFDNMIVFWEKFAGDHKTDSSGFTVKARAEMANQMRSRFFEEVKNANNDSSIKAIAGSEAGLAPGEKVPQSAINNYAAQTAVSHFRNQGTDEQKKMIADFKVQYGDKDFAKQFSAFLGNIQGEANEVTVNAVKGSDSAIAGIREWLDKFKNPDLGKPLPVNYEPLVGAQEKLKTHTPEDELVKVGNFFGSSRGVINNTQALLTQHAAQTAINTAQCATALKTLVNKTGMGGSGQTQWAPN